MASPLTVAAMPAITASHGSCTQNSGARSAASRPIHGAQSAAACGSAGSTFFISEGNACVHLP